MGTGVTIERRAALTTEDFNGQPVNIERKRVESTPQLPLIPASREGSGDYVLRQARRNVRLLQMFVL